MQSKKHIEDFVTTLKTALEQGTFVKIALGHYVGPEHDLKKIDIRKIVIKRVEKLSFTYHYKTRDIVKNYDIDVVVNDMHHALDSEFKAATLFTTEFDLVMEKGALKQKPATQTVAPSVDHDRAKKRLVPTDGTYYLADLKITDKNGRVYDKAQDKFRQINKYIQIIDALIKDAPSESYANIVDMGAGKGYLTFALYDYLKNIRNTNARVTGVEFRPDLVKLCNEIAAGSFFESLSFVEGTIDNFDASGTNMLIALHACDTATDDALAKGMRAGAEFIVAAPCCHKQIRREMEKNGVNAPLDLMTRHGIFMEREAEMLTDTLRGLLLEYHGYDVKIFEFISAEHTAKNVMIVAQKKKNGPSNQEKIAADIAALKQKFGVTTHYLETLMVA